MCPTSNVVIANAFSSVERHPLPALDGVEATWLDDGAKRALSARIRDEAARLRPTS
ncbi:MAG TPA: hypothetical protein VIZ43_20140 [Trebonia sp.]